MTDNSLAADASPDQTRRPRGKRGALLFFRDLLIIFVVALLVSFLIKTFLVRSFYIPSGSMENTLQIQDRILVNELVPDVVALNRGDVVVFQDPGGWLPPAADVEQPPVTAAVEWVLSIFGLVAPDSDDHLIKRVIGLPGDRVACCNPLGQMTVNGVPLSEPYVKLPAGTEKVSADPFDVVVPEGSLWVMGDNRYNSKDSRYNGDTPGGGFVPIDNVVGRAFVITWPSSNWSWLDNYPSVFGAVPDPADE